jgi:hypothetical protein
VASISHHISMVPLNLRNCVFKLGSNLEIIRKLLEQCTLHPKFLGFKLQSKPTLNVRYLVDFKIGDKIAYFNMILTTQTIFEWYMVEFSLKDGRYERHVLEGDYMLKIC